MRAKRDALKASILGETQCVETSCFLLLTYEHLFKFERTCLIILLPICKFAISYCFGFVSFSDSQKFLKLGRFQNISEI